MADEPPPELVSALRGQAFEEIERQADLVASYGRSLAEAAFRGDKVTVGVHLRQLRECVVVMFKTYRESVLGNGQDVAETRDSRSDRADQRSGDGVA